MPSLLLSEIFSPHDWSVTKIIEYFYSPLSRVIHFYPLNPTMCQFGVRNVGSKSPTGYAVKIEATAEIPALLLTDRHLDSFEDFEEEIDRDYSIAATKATRRRQLGK